jgi:small multidrug resistance pump
MLPSWLFLLVAIGSEVAGTSCMRLSQGFAKPLPSIAMFVCYGMSLGALTMAIKRIEIGTAYAVWSGLGTVLITAIGVLFFSEGMDWLKAASIALVIVGVVGLRMGMQA